MSETHKKPAPASTSTSTSTSMSATQSMPVVRLLQWSQRKGLYFLSAVLAIIGVAGTIVPYFAAANMIVGILSGVRDWGFFVGWGLFAAGGYVLYLVCHYTSTAVSHVATFATISRIRLLLAHKLTRVPMGYVLDTPSGTLKSLIVEKVDSIETTLAHAVPELTSNVLVPIVVVVYLFMLDWRLALSALVPIAVGMLCTMGMAKDYAQWYGRTVEASKVMNNTSVEYVAGIEVIKAFGQSASSYEKFSQAVRISAHSFIDWMAHCQIWSDGALSIAPATLVTVLPLGCLFVVQGTLDPAVFAMCAVLSVGIFPPLYAALGFTDTLAQVGTTVEEIAAVLDLPEQNRSATKASPDGHDITLSDVHFSYDADEVIHGVDLHIASGHITALVGPSGSGKSTLARLIAGFWDPNTGTVSIGGCTLEEFTADQLAAQIAYVDQDSYLFDDTIMNNIRMGSPDASDEDVIACAQASGCHEFISALPQGYQTVVGGSGGHLSGGERQRVAIARAMLKDAPIILLDEATAYADPESEAEVESAVARLVRGKTLVVIAHRLSTVRDADQIVVMNKGCIEAQGTHSELMQQCPLYASMYNAHIGARDVA
ncbi:ABC transporter ATP-binding protein [Cryptobacterium curtum]|uniref:ABC transporter ATP-binding protein n=1 Tax=Cryptobacterium curtum TaxID=84163 RepID=UPI0028D07258|nr:ABC transporter ATP-binding protein [Cryptobacterium curtum]